MYVMINNIFRLQLSVETFGHSTNESTMFMKISLSFRTSICGEAAEVIVVDQNLSRCCSRASNPPDVAEGCDTEPAGHQPICPLYTQVSLLFEHVLASKGTSVVGGRSLFNFSLKKMMPHFFIR